MAKKPTVKLWSTEKGKLVNFTLRVDQNNEIVAEHGSAESEDYEHLKFPSDLSKQELQKLFAKHNSDHKGIKAITEEEMAEEAERRQAAEDLVASLGE